MEVKFAFSKEDYKAIASELYALMVAQAIPAGFQPAPAPAPASVAPAPVSPPVAAPAPAPVAQVLAPVATVAQQPAPTLPTLSAVTYHAAPNGERRDDRVPAGTPGTVTLPKTGHTLSLPEPDKEGWLGYVRRVSFQAGSDLEKSGVALYQGDGAFAGYGGFKADGSNWAIAADKLYNPGAYADPSAEARAHAEWAAQEEAIRARQNQTRDAGQVVQITS